MFHHKCFHLRVKIEYVVWSVERREVLIGTVICDCDSRSDNLSEILHQSLCFTVNISTVEIWQQSTVAFKLLSPEWQGVCAFFAVLIDFFSLGTGQFFRPGGEGVGEFWMQHDKIYLIPLSPLPQDSMDILMIPPVSFL